MNTFRGKRRQHVKYRRLMPCVPNSSNERRRDETRQAGGATKSDIAKRNAEE